MGSMDLLGDWTIEADQAIVYYQLTKAVLGEKWISKDLFRIGASKLADNLFSEISNIEK